MDRSPNLVPRTEEEERAHISAAMEASKADELPPAKRRRVESDSTRDDRFAYAPRTDEEERMQLLAAMEASKANDHVYASAEASSSGSYLTSGLHFSESFSSTRSSTTPSSSASGSSSSSQDPLYIWDPLVLARVRADNSRMASRSVSPNSDTADASNPEKALVKIEYEYIDITNE